ncbi:EpsG family protein [Chryseobacterium taichungense]|uniref:EpsG family protein n=1 Tax=Chryseobacterium taichungense TaxID=295069 RepID=UPI0028A8ACAA|nr:hypothetical protein [Chryseobacterium taichungense]
MKKNTLDYQFILYLIIVTFLCIFKVYFAYLTCNGYAFADWLINYQEAGFSRRGLPGTVFVFLYHVFSIKVQYAVFFTQTIVYVLFFYFLYKLFRGKKANLIDALFLFTPFCLWGFFSDPAIGARKDGVLWLLFVAFTYYLSQNKLTKTKEYIFLLLFAVSVFIHESFVFYASYFLIVLYLHNGKIDIKKSILILLSFCVPAGIILLTGINTDYHKTLQIVRECNINLQKENIFDWKETQLIKIDYYTKEIKNLSLYAISVILQLGFITFYMFLKKFTPENRKKLLMAFALAFFVSIPLFLIAIDIGRWFYNSFILFEILLISLIPISDKKFFTPEIFKNQGMLIFILLVLLADFVYRVPSALIGIQIGLPLRFFLNIIPYI